MKILSVCIFTFLCVQGITNYLDSDEIVLKYPNGKQLAATVNKDGWFVLARFNREGNLDDTFGTSGVVRTQVSGGNSKVFLNRVILEPDGQIMLEGSRETEQVRVHYLENGELDSNFGRGGISTIR